MIHHTFHTFHTSPRTLHTPSGRHTRSGKGRINRPGVGPSIPHLPHLSTPFHTCAAPSFSPSSHIHHTTPLRGCGGVVGRRIERPSEPSRLHTTPHLEAEA